MAEALVRDMKPLNKTENPALNTNYCVGLEVPLCTPTFFVKMYFGYKWLQNKPCQYLEAEKYSHFIMFLWCLSWPFMRLLGIPGPWEAKNELNRTEYWSEQRLWSMCLSWGCWGCAANWRKLGETPSLPLGGRAAIGQTDLQRKL